MFEIICTEEEVKEQEIQEGEVIRVKQEKETML